MKCYFTFNNDIENNPPYLQMLEAALASARQNTTLDLYALFDGNKEDKIYQILQKYHIKTTICHLSFYDKLQHFYDEAYEREHNMPLNRLKQAAANFMKFEIPEYEHDDECILYTDLDTLFLKDINTEKLYTKTLAAAPEFAQDYDRIKGYKYFNAGIMVINVPELKKRRQQLFDMLDNKKRPYQECWDQGFFNELYKDDFEELPLEYNWKPYWGIHDKAKIVHLHGYIKPERPLGPDVGPLLVSWPNALDGHLFYFMEFYRVLGKNNDLYLIQLMNQLVKQRQKAIDHKKYKFLTVFLYKIHRFLSCKRICPALRKKIAQKLQKRGINCD